MNTWRSRYVLLGVLASGALGLAMLGAMGYWLVTQFYFGAFAAAVCFVASALWCQFMGAELRYRFRVWNRQWKIFRGEI